jgi:predicted methyltransferase
MKTKFMLLSFALLLTACGQEQATSETPVAANTTAESATSIYADAVASTSRLAGDYARDAGRKPAQVLEFLGLERGMTVLDMFSGGGYYTELVASVVGDEGHVVSHSNKAYLNFVGEEFKQRHGEDRLPNVAVLMAENNELSLDAEEFDAILLVLAYHDTYYADAENGWAPIDLPKLLAELNKGLKPDGFIGIVDHYAAPGTAHESGGTVHRIDPAIVIADMEAAGFTCETESDLLRNLNDDYGKNVFDPEVRGKTDRFILRFRKTG